LKQEHDAAERVKREVPILVILGNPPYNGFAGVAVGEERDLSNAYRTTIKAPAPQGQGLNELYVRFYRMAERRIVEMKGEGVVSFISNYSWLDSLSSPGMRERYLEEFDCIWIDSLNGDKYRTGKLTPTGEPDPSVFSTDLNREGIQVGTAVALLVRKRRHRSAQIIQFRDWWGKNKRSDILGSTLGSVENPYQVLTPELRLGLPFRLASLVEAYDAWPLLPQLFPLSFAGVKTSRDVFLVSIDRDRLDKHLKDYFDSSISNEALRRLYPEVMRTSARFDADRTRAYLVARGYVEENVVRYCYRPFDVRWLYWEPETKLLDEKRTEYASHVFQGNLWFSCTTRFRKDAFYLPLVTGRLADLNVIEANVQMFPLLSSSSQQLHLENSSLPQVFNLSENALTYIHQLGANFDDCFFHTISILHSSDYRTENSEALRQDWPRIPLPKTMDALLNSARLGRRLAALLDPDQIVDSVTGGAIIEPLKSFGVVSRTGGGALNPNEDLRVTAGWGHVGKGGATMPGRGKLIERDYTLYERESIERGAVLLRLSADEAFAHLGERTCDVYLNDVAYWRNVPSRVWDYTIGGYQVIKKWLSYREFELLGRPLTTDEAREVTNIARRIAAIILTAQALDLNYQTVKNAIYDWAPQKL
jgi:predicted helicase